MRSASSVGVNYSSACRGRSRADFIAKLSIVEEEADETIYWMELLEELGQKTNSQLQRLKGEAKQLVAIVEENSQGQCQLTIVDCRIVIRLKPSFF